MELNETDKVKIQAIASACEDFCLNRGCEGCSFTKSAQIMNDCVIYRLAKSKTLTEKEETEEKETIESKTCHKIVALLEDLTFYQGIAVLEIAKEIILKETRKKEFDL